MLNDWINDFYSVEDTIDPNLADNEGNTSLIHAAQSGQHECLLVLLENFRPGLKTQLFWLKKRLQVSPWKGQSKSMRSTRLDFQHWWKQQFKDISIAFQHCLSMAPMMLLKTVERGSVLKVGHSIAIETKSLFNFRSFLENRLEIHFLPNFFVGSHPMDSEWKKYRDENNPFNSKSSSINIKIWWIWCH